MTWKGVVGFVGSASYEICAACILALQRIYIFASAYARHHFERFPPPDRDDHFKITKTLVFCEDAGWICTRANPDFADITEWFSIDSWAEDIECNFPTWTKWKLEIRYTHRGDKFRHVIRQGDSLTWPPAHDDADTEHVNKLHEVTKPTGILSASLIPHAGTDASHVDITHRVRKYAGVTRDFSTASANLRAHDVLPMDDNEWNAERFETIRIIKTHPIDVVRVDNVKYAENGLIDEKK